MRNYDTLDVRLANDVLRIAFDRPDDLNASNAELHEELADVFKEANRTDARVVVLTGNGPAFSSGGDLNSIHEDLDDPATFQAQLREAEEIIRDILALEKPLVARVNGDAIGVGATIALYCDIVIMSEKARLGDPHVRIGLVAGDGGAVIWPLLTNMHKAKELLMTGDILTAEEAHDLGLVNHVVPHDELDDEVEQMVHKLASGPQDAIRYTKLALNNWVEFGTDLVLRESLAMEGLSQQHPDHREGVEAFLENRRPNFPSGRDPHE